jgi:uncharacterized protein (TIGR03437 family)
MKLRIVIYIIFIGAMAGLICGSLARRVAAAPFTLDDPASPVTVTFDGATGRMSVTVKATKTTWVNPVSGGGDTLTISNVSQPDSLHLTASARTNRGYDISLRLELVPSSGDLVVTIGGNPNTNISGRIQYPWAFFPTDGSGFAVLPFFSGYVVPTTETSWRAPSPHSRMEWLGGTDRNDEEGWVCILDPGQDVFLTIQTGTVGGNARLGGVPQWSGSNANVAKSPGLLSYDRKATFRFFTTGGYVSLAKHFRQFALSKGWLKTLMQKKAENSNVDQLIGAPVIYLWGDGRGTAMLDGLRAAGIQKALIQVSINHVDQNNGFPNQQFADGAGWSNEVRNHGYAPGIYDIYASYNNLQRTPPYNGFYYLWPSVANPQWFYAQASGAPNGTRVSPAMAKTFARDTRLPAHVSRFGLDAFFFDVVCAEEPGEDYDATNGHFATRADDIANRAGLLNAAYDNPNLSKRLLVGTEQVKSWAIPYLHWAEGVFWLGSSSVSPAQGSFNNNAYPSITSDVIDPTNSSATNQLPLLLTEGYQAPLWDLVYHECMRATSHWHRAQNKYLYAWDQADLSALIRGQSPLLHLVYDGAPGSAGRAIQGATDARDGKLWDTRWTNANVRARVMQTYNTVCAWQAQVAYLEMIAHKRLTSDRSVQMAEFSADGGQSGKGIVVNFGIYDGAYGVTGTVWNGTLRGQALAVPVNGYRTYSWTAAAPQTQASVSAASYSSATLAPESIVAAFGSNLATATLVASATPLPTALAGTTVKVRDNSGVERLAPLFFVSPTQINYLVPAFTATGAATITITSGNGSVSIGNTQIAAFAPGLFTADASGQGLAAAIALRIKADGSQQYEPVGRFDPVQNKFVAVPIDLGPDLGNASDQVFLILFGTGLRFRSGLSGVNVRIGGVEAQASFVGAQGGFVGLDQANVKLSRDLIGRGELDVVLAADGQSANTVRIQIK